MALNFGNFSLDYVDEEDPDAELNTMAFDWSSPNASDHLPQKYQAGSMHRLRT